MADDLPFRDRTRIRARALFVARRLDLRSLENRRLASQPLVVEAGSHGVAVLFRFGAVVLFELQPLEESAFLRLLASLANEPLEDIEVEELDVVVRDDEPEHAHGGVVTLRTLTIERLQIVADVLAKSVVLNHYEHALAEAFNEVEPLAESLAGGRPRTKGRSLVRHVGEALLVQTRTVGRVAVADKPEVLWEHPALEALYARLADEYELTERDAALERKLAVVSRTATTLLDLLNHAQSLRVEWYIVALIVVEIALTLYQMLVGASSH